MRRLASAAALALGVWLLAPTAHADAGSKAGERCVTHEEYQKIHDGLAKARVQRIFDSAGHLYLREGRLEIRSYEPCTDRRFGWVDVNYMDGRVDAKRVHWG
jgi:hypothetical protein